MTVESSTNASPLRPLNLRIQTSQSTRPTVAHNKLVGTIDDLTNDKSLIESGISADLAASKKLLKELKEQRSTACKKKMNLEKYDERKKTSRLVKDKKSEDQRGSGKRS